MLRDNKGSCGKGLHSFNVGSSIFIAERDH